MMSRYLLGKMWTLKEESVIKIESASTAILKAKSATEGVLPSNLIPAG